MEKAADSGEPIDIRSIIHCLVVDTLFALCFGKSFGSLEHGDQERTPQVAYHSAFSSSVLQQIADALRTVKLSTVFGSMPWTLPYMRRFGPYMPDWTWVGKGIKVRDQVRQVRVSLNGRPDASRSVGRADVDRLGHNGYEARQAVSRLARRADRVSQPGDGRADVADGNGSVRHRLHSLLHVF